MQKAFESRAQNRLERTERGLICILMRFKMERRLLKYQKISHIIAWQCRVSGSVNQHKVCPCLFSVYQCVNRKSVMRSMKSHYHVEGYPVWPIIGFLMWPSTRPAWQPAARIEKVTLVAFTLCCAYCINIIYSGLAFALLPCLTGCSIFFSTF